MFVRPTSGAQGLNLLGGIPITDFTGAIRAVRGLRLLRLSRMLRFLKPIAPTIIRVLDRRINKGLSIGYDIGKAYVVAHEEVARLIPTVMDYPPHILYFRELCERARVTLIKAMGVLNEERPDIAVSVKTRQSIRHVLNQIRKRVRELKQEGVVDLEEAERFEEELDVKVKRLSSFPHSVHIPGPMQLLRNLPWLEYMSDEVYDFIGMHVEEKEYVKDSVIADVGDQLDGILLVIVGVVRVAFGNSLQDTTTLLPDCMFIEVNYDGAEEYLPRGNSLNEAGALLGLKRDSAISAASDVVRVS